MYCAVYSVMVKGLFIILVIYLCSCWYKYFPCLPVSIIDCVFCVMMQIAPENTMIAFQYAADNKVLAFESDVIIR